MGSELEVQSRTMFTLYVVLLLVIMCSGSSSDQIDICRGIGSSLVDWVTFLYTGVMKYGIDLCFLSMYT